MSKGIEMKSLYSIFLAAFFVFDCAAFAGEPKKADPPKAYDGEGLAPLAPSDVDRLKVFPFDVSICKINAIPAGYIIVSEGSSISCPGSFPNAWTIRQPGQTDVACKVSPIPSNYSIIGEGSSIQCPGSFPNTWTIRRI